MTYTYDEALEASTKYFHKDDLAAKVTLDKYLMRNLNNEIIEKTPDDMHWREAKELARIERNKFKKPFSVDFIYSTLKYFRRIVPQGGLMYGIDNPQFISLSNCFVVEAPQDSYSAILKTDEHLVQISKRRGGVGLDLSHLRPNGSITKNSSRTSTGPLCFARRYSNSIREVGQDGRRGALMLTLSVHHPDIVEFAESKQDLNEIIGANISIRLTDEFMTAMVNDEEYEQRWPVVGESKITKMVNAKKVWKTIVKCAWNAAEPGVLFWDKIISESPADCYRKLGFETESTNPCSELPLCANDSCRLLLLNSFSYVRNPFTSQAYFDFDFFYQDAQIAQRYLDDIVDLELECIDKILDKIRADDGEDIDKVVERTLWEDIRKKCEQGRRTGLGQTGLGDCLAALNIKYGSKKAIVFTEKFYRYLKFGSYRSSIDMAKELGPFPIWDWQLEKNNPFLLRFKDESIEVDGKTIEGYDLYHDISEFGRRNIANLTTAPAGSVSLLTQTTSSAEPAYFLSSKRRKKVNENDEGARVDEVDDSGDKWMVFDVKHPQLQTWMDVTGKTNIKESPWWGCCAEDVDPYDRIKMQAAAGAHIDHSISSTINLPSNTTQKKIGDIYEEAWKQGLKGITVYRAGCRDGVIVEDKNTERERILPCDVHHTICDGEHHFVLVGMKDGKPYEVFSGHNGFLPAKIKSGQIIRQRKDYYKATFDDTDLELSPIGIATNESQDIITRLTSLSLRNGVDMHVIVRQLEKAGEKRGMNSFTRGIARVLKKYIPDGTKDHGESCPECGTSPLVRQAGCMSCSCGWSKCL